MEFLVVYIREAHAVDGSWPINDAGHPFVQDPLTLQERTAVAQTCMAGLALDPMPAVVDDMDDSANLAYEAWPDRLLLIDAVGGVAYRGAPGPYGFEPDELEAAIRSELGLPPAPPAAQAGAAKPPGN